MTWEQFQKYLEGKVLLVGITFVDKIGDVIESFQTHGIVSELTNEGIIKLIRNDGSIYQLPYDPDTIEEAERGEYRLRATGEIITDPDFISTWEIVSADDKNLENIKRHGYLPPV